MSLHLPLARYRFRILIEESIKLPDYAGSALRGAFGRALKDLSCVTKAKSCEGCILLESCNYPRLFEAHQTQHLLQAGQDEYQNKNKMPVPYIIEPDLNKHRVFSAGQILEFNMVLIGEDCLAKLGLIIMAWKRVFSRGLRQQMGKGYLQTVAIARDNNVYEEVYNSEFSLLTPHQATLTLPNFDASADYHLWLKTPLRIESKKSPIGEREMNAHFFLSSLYRRINTLNYYYFKNPLLTKLCEQKIDFSSIHDEKNIFWRDWTRYSSRQQQEMILGGLQGHYLLKALPSSVQLMIYLGQWLHLGKETAFGLGYYVISQEPWLSKSQLLAK